MVDPLGVDAEHVPVANPVETHIVGTRCRDRPPNGAEAVHHLLARRPRGVGIPHRVYERIRGNECVRSRHKSGKNDPLTSAIHADTRMERHSVRLPENPEVGHRPSFRHGAGPGKHAELQ
jgi:hypothetical protein